MAKMTIKQQRFADEYIISGNATEAAILAGYSEKYAGQNADKLLKNTKIKKYIEERLEELDNEKIADQKEILQYLTSVLRGEEQEEQLLVVKRGIVEEVELHNKKPDMNARTKAAELLGKRHAMWTDKMDVSGGVVFISGDDDLED